MTFTMILLAALVVVGVVLTGVLLVTFLSVRKKRKSTGDKGQ